MPNAVDVLLADEVFLFDIPGDDGDELMIQKNFYADNRMISIFFSKPNI